MQSAELMETAIHVMRSSMAIRRSNNSTGSSVGGVGGSGRDSIIMGSENARILSENYPHLFEMCMSVTTDEDIDSFHRFLPMMLRQRDTISSGNHDSLESATARIASALNKTYIEPLGIPVENMDKSTNN